MSLERRRGRDRIEGGRRGVSCLQLEWGQRENRGGEKGHESRERERQRENEGREKGREA